MKRMKFENTDEFLAELSAEEWEILFETIDEKDFAIDADTKRKIEEKTMERMKGPEPQNVRHEDKPVKSARRWIALAASIALIAVLTLFVEPVQAAMRDLFAWIPGIGIVQDAESKSLYFGDEIVADDPQGVLIGEPAIAASDEGIQITYSYRIHRPLGELTDSEIEESLRYPEDQKLEVNGKSASSQPQGYIVGGDETMRMFTYFAADIKAGDTIRYTSDLGIKIDAVLQSAETLHPEDIAQDANASGTVYAMVHDGGENWEVYLYRVGKNGRRIDIDSAWPIDELAVTTDTGEQIPLMPPEMGGTGLELPYTMPKGDFQKGTLRIPGLFYTLDETVDITVPIPQKGEDQIVDQQHIFDSGSILVESVRIAEESAQLNERETLTVDVTLQGDENPIVWIDLGGDSSYAEMLENTEKGVRIRYGMNVPANRSDLQLHFYHPVFNDTEPLEIPLDFTAK